MTPETLAALLNGREYRNEMTREEEQAAKAAGLVVVFGASDDLVELRGAIYDEVGAYHGTSFRVDREGLKPAWDDIDHEDEDACETYFRRKAVPFSEVRVVGPPWLFFTSVLHSKFRVMEEGEVYGQGIVFRLADAGSEQG